MAAINFEPDSPSAGNTFVANGVTYTYDGTKWKTSIVSNDFFPNTGGTVSGNIVLDGELQHSGDTDTKIHFDTDTIKLDTAGSERFRVGSAGQLGIGGATYGTSGQVLTSGGASAAPSWSSGGQILQVVSVTKTDTWSTNNTTFADVTDLSLNITPSTTDSKILITGHLGVSCKGNTSGFYYRLAKGGNAITGAIADAAGNRPRTTGAYFIGDVGAIENSFDVVPFVYLDSPGSTDQQTYSVQARKGPNTVTLYVNRSVYDRDTADYEPRYTSTLTLMEVAS